MGEGGNKYQMPPPMLVKKWRRANESAASLSNEQLHHGVFLKFLSTFRKYAMPFGAHLDSEIATKMLKMLWVKMCPR